jgi:hypothetical protein
MDFKFNSARKTSFKATSGSTTAQHHRKCDFVRPYKLLRRNCLPFRSTWVHPPFLMRFVSRSLKYGRKVNWIVKWYGKYGRKISRKVKRYEKYGRKVSWKVERYGQYGRKASWIVKNHIFHIFSLFNWRNFRSYDVTSGDVTSGQGHFR